MTTMTVGNNPLGDLIRKRIEWLRKSYSAIELSRWEEILSVLVMLEASRFSLGPQLVPTIGQRADAEVDDYANPEIVSVMKPEIEERFSKRFESILNMFYVLEAFFAKNPAEPQRVLELCCGDSGIGIVLAALGYDCLAMDLSESIMKTADKLSRTVLKEHDSKHKAVVGDVLASPIVDAAAFDVWIACHPCLDGVSLPDRIIADWVKCPSARKLILVPCCSANWSDDYPAHLDEWIGGEEKWLSLCQGANDVVEAFLSRLFGENATDCINSARVAYLRANGASAEWYGIGHQNGACLIVAQK